jgi:hypothetical protein
MSKEHQIIVRTDKHKQNVYIDGVEVNAETYMELLNDNDRMRKALERLFKVYNSCKCSHTNIADCTHCFIKKTLFQRKEHNHE